MHNLYEGLFRDLLNLISISHWEEFDKLFLIQKFPSFSSTNIHGLWQKILDILKL